jgi:Tfp pilus assembly protein PilZ
MDKRRCQRLKIELPAMIKGIDEEIGSSIASTADLSGLGFRLSTKKQLDVGEEVLIQIRIDHQDLNLKTKVMWAERDNESHKEEFIAGLKIIDTSVHDESLFIKFFAKKLLASSTR